MLLSYDDVFLSGMELEIPQEVKNINVIKTIKMAEAQLWNVIDCTANLQTETQSSPLPPSAGG